MSKPTGSGRRLLFSVTKKDLRVDTFRAGGPGGQNQNKRESGVRITHPDSGAVGESREHRTQEQNKAAAFRRMTETHRFRAWIRVETARLDGRRAMIEAEVEKMLDPTNLKVEVHDEQGKWVAA